MHEFALRTSIEFFHVECLFLIKFVVLEKLVIDQLLRYLLVTTLVKHDLHQEIVRLFRLDVETHRIEGAK